MSDIDDPIKQLDEETVLRVSAQGHPDQFVYRFPSGIMTTVWADRARPNDEVLVLDEDHVRDVLTSSEGANPIELVSFDESPYSAENSDDSDSVEVDADPVEGCRCPACRRRRGEEVSILREGSDGE